MPTHKKTQKMRVLALGDRWVAAPRNDLFAEPELDIASQLAAAGVDIDNEFVAIDTAAALLQPSVVRQIKHRLQKEAFDFVLFSGGLADLLSAGATSVAVLPDWSTRLNVIELAYRELIGIEKDVPHFLGVLAHTYDRLHGVGAPVMDLRHALDGLADRLQQLSKEFPRQFFVADTRGTLKETDWATQTLPTSAGFEKLAERLFRCMQDVSEQRWQREPSDTLVGAGAPMVVSAENLGSGTPPRDVPLYHEHHLAVRYRSDAPAPALSAAEFETTGPLLLSGATAGAQSIVGAPERAGPARLLASAVHSRGTTDALSELWKKGLVTQVTPQKVPRRSINLAMGTGVAAALGELPPPQSRRALIRVGSTSDLVEVKKALQSDPQIALVERVPIRFAVGRASGSKRPGRLGAGSSAGTAASATSNLQWAPQRINWQAGPSNTVEVAVLDTGCDLTHPDLSSANVRTETRYVPPPTPGRSFDPHIDIHGHGTHVSGILAAQKSAQGKMQGLLKAQIVSYKIFDDTPSFVDAFQQYTYLVNPELYLAALADLLDSTVDVVNLSIGGYAPPDENERDAFNELIDAGLVVVAAMGNDGTVMPSYPAAHPRVIAVGATDSSDLRWSGSNRGTHIELMAPGADIFSTLPTQAGQTGFSFKLDATGQRVPGVAQARKTDYDNWTGTSMAAPHVSAACGFIIGQRLQSRRPGVQPVLSRLRGAVDLVPGMGNQQFTTDYGHGRLNWSRL